MTFPISPQQQNQLNLHLATFDPPALTFGYQKTSPILNDFHLTIERGTFWGIGRDQVAVENRL